jgi:hypothetical protein
MYHEQSSQVKARQWERWEGYMKDFCTRENFCNAWPELGPQFDTKFVGFMDKLIFPIDPTKMAMKPLAAGGQRECQEFPLGNIQYFRRIGHHP